MNELDQELIRSTPQTVVDQLDQAARQIDPSTVARLHTSRHRALARLHARHTGEGLLALSRPPALLALALAAGVALMIWFNQHPSPISPRPAPDTGDLDIQLLTGEVPPAVFADWGLVSQENVEDLCLADS